MPPPEPLICILCGKSGATEQIRITQWGRKVEGPMCPISEETQCLHRMAERARMDRSGPKP